MRHGTCLQRARARARAAVRSGGWRGRAGQGGAGRGRAGQGGAGRGRAGRGLEGTARCAAVATSRASAAGPGAWGERRGAVTRARRVTAAFWAGQSGLVKAGWSKRAVQSAAPGRGARRAARIGGGPLRVPRVVRHARHAWRDGALAAGLGAALRVAGGGRRRGAARRGVRGGAARDARRVIPAVECAAL